MNKSMRVANILPEQGYTDPHAFVEDGKIYLFCGHDRSRQTDDTWVMDYWQVLSSDNLTDWKKEYQILPTDTYIGDYPNCWAGDIAKKDGRYYWYFSNRNENTGVMVSDCITGPFEDALGEPFLPNGIVPGVEPYDPCVYEEDGKYTLFFGCNTYYAVELGEDMISLASEPRAIIVKDKDGNEVVTDDKSTVFKRNGIYYLMWGRHYCMSDHLLGPYIYQGQHMASDHNSVFVWKDQWYLVTEHKDISIFYRGVGIKAMNFDEDGRILVPEDDVDHQVNHRRWNFQFSDMGWESIGGTSLAWMPEGGICGKLEIGNQGIKEAAIQSAIWPIVDLRQCNQVQLEVVNQTPAEKLKIWVAAIDDSTLNSCFWNNKHVNWENEAGVFELEILSNSPDVQRLSLTYKSELLKGRYLKRLKVEPAIGADSGSWEIRRVEIF